MHRRIPQVAVLVGKYPVLTHCSKKKKKKKVKFSSLADHNKVDRLTAIDLAAAGIWGFGAGKTTGTGG